ncbi:hypothetical protein [Streptomyces sp. NPDC057418]
MAGPVPLALDTAPHRAWAAARAAQDAGPPGAPVVEDDPAKP